MEQEEVVEQKIYVHPVYRQSGVVLLGYALGMWSGAPEADLQDFSRFSRYTEPEEFKKNFPSYQLYEGFKANFEAFKDIIPKLDDPVKCRMEMIQLRAVMAVIDTMSVITLKDMPEVTHSDKFIKQISGSEFYCATYVNLGAIMDPGDGFSVGMDGNGVNISGEYKGKTTILFVPHTSYYDTLERFPFMWAIYKSVEQLAQLDYEGFKNDIESPGFGFIPSHISHEFIVGSN